MNTCPRCGREYSAYPAFSREDNATPICPDCGIVEALKAIGCSDKECQRILAKVKEYEHDKKTAP